MIGNRFSRVARGLALCGTLALGGCVVATDVLNPALLTGLGFDPQTVVPPQGKVVVAFQNSTSATASFFSAYLKTDFGASSEVSQISAVNVGPGETRSAVLDCPVAVISPAPGIDNFGAIGDGAVIELQTDADLVELAYTGEPLLNGRDFQCGDVILIRATENAGFGVQVQLLPGR